VVTPRARNPNMKWSKPMMKVKKANPDPWCDRCSFKGHQNDFCIACIMLAGMAHFHRSLLEQQNSQNATSRARGQRKLLKRVK
jgi:hypothetical protein